MPELRGRLVVLRPPVEADEPALFAMRERPEIFEWWGPPDGGFPYGEDANTTCLTILAEGAVAGFIQFHEEPDPDYRHASIDLLVDPDRHRTGLGSDALRAVIDHLMQDRGHHRITIDPAADNAAAIRCYERVGFRTVGTLDACWRDPTGRWRDVVLMELVTRR